VQLSHLTQHVGLLHPVHDRAVLDSPRSRNVAMQKLAYAATTA
jgi:hypothetical protein